MSAMPEHSPKGASGAERWMNCPGSNVMLKALALPPSDDTDFSKAGTAAHEAAAHCLREGKDTWEIMGEKFNGVVVDAEMADAVQMYLSEVRRIEDEAGPGVFKLVEQRIADNSIDKMFYGTVDSAVLGAEVWDVTDFKYGVGIAVDAEDNPQLKYYAVGLMASHLAPKRIRLRIVQPRAFHTAGPIREWETTYEELKAWRDEKLIPAMARADVDATLAPGEWCRFCPAKLACPMLKALYKAMAEANPADAAMLTDAQLGMEYGLLEAVMIRKRAVEEETLKRLTRGATVTGAKLVPKKSNRVFTAEGAKKAPEKFGDDAWEPRQLRSPAQIATLGTAGKSFVKEYAYSPNTGFTVAREDDTRVAVKVRTAEDAFANYKGPSDAP